MDTIKKHDFVEIEYTGKIKEDNVIFDTTYEKVAKELELKPLSAGNPGRETKSKDKNKGK